MRTCRLYQTQLGSYRPTPGLQLPYQQNIDWILLSTEYKINDLDAITSRHEKGGIISASHARLRDTISVPPSRSLGARSIAIFTRHIDCITPGIEALILEAQSVLQRFTALSDKLKNTQAFTAEERRVADDEQDLLGPTY